MPGPVERRSPESRDGASGLPISLLCETHSSVATRREESLPPASSFTCPVRTIVLRIVAGDCGPTTPVGVDVKDVWVSVSRIVDIGYLLAIRRVGRVVVVRSVLGDVELASAVGVDRVNLPVVSGVVLVGYLGAAR